VLRSVIGPEIELFSPTNQTYVSILRWRRQFALIHRGAVDRDADRFSRKRHRNLLEFVGTREGRRGKGDQGKPNLSA
jgi:hypothetical protein